MNFQIENTRCLIKALEDAKISFDTFDEHKNLVIERDEGE
jgi:hypothetical protein